MPFIKTEDQRRDDEPQSDETTMTHPDVTASPSSRQTNDATQNKRVDKKLASPSHPLPPRVQDKSKKGVDKKVSSPSPPLPNRAQDKDKKADMLPRVLELIQDELRDDSRWNEVVEMIEEDPSLARRHVPLICQGENSKGFLVHYLVSNRRRRPTPVSVLEALVTAYPLALSYADPRGGRRSTPWLATHDPGSPR